MEPNPNFAFITKNTEAEIGQEFKNKQPSLGGFNQAALTLSDGSKANAIAMRPMGGALTPSHPVRVRFSKKGAVGIGILGVLHQKG